MPGRALNQVDSTSRLLNRSLGDPLNLWATIHSHPTPTRSKGNSPLPVKMLFLKERDSRDSILSTNHELKLSDTQPSRNLRTMLNALVSHQEWYEVLILP